MVTHSSRQANLSWSLPYDGKSPILAFHLEFHRPDAGKGDFLVSSLFKLFKDLFSLFFQIGFQGPQVITVPGNATWWEVDFLQPNRLYFVRLLAVNALGASKPTPRLRIKTANEAPEGVATDIQALVNESQSIIVQWKVRFY